MEEEKPTEIKRQVPYDPEVEKIKIEAYKDIQKGWQDKVIEVANILKEVWLVGKEAEKKVTYYIFIVISIIFLGTLYLTKIGVVPGESFAFLVGIIVGYLISITPIRRPGAGGQ